MKAAVAAKVLSTSSAGASQRWGRLYAASLFLLLAVLVSGAGYRVLGEGEWSWSECFYMAAITLSTVGFGETLDGMDRHPWARLWTLGVIFIGSGTLLYFVSMLTAMIVEGDLEEAIRGRRMLSRIDRLTDHVVVVGAAHAGGHVVDELVASRRPFVVVDSDQEALERLLEHHGDRALHVHGDPTDDEVLLAAGIDRAQGVVVALEDDRETLFVVVTARQLNEGARIIAHAIDPSTEAKLRRCGAESVVSPFYIGAMRMVSEMIRPTVVKFLDQMLRDKDKNLRIEELLVGAGSPLSGKSLAELALGARHDVLVMAVKVGDTFAYNPSGDHVVPAGSTLVVLAEADKLASLRAELRG
jgi:voltage-gated potassium channel